jgi:hypothetical protein
MAKVPNLQFLGDQTPPTTRRELTTHRFALNPKNQKKFKEEKFKLPQQPKKPIKHPIPLSESSPRTPTKNKNFQKILDQSFNNNSEDSDISSSSEDSIAPLSSSRRKRIFSEIAKDRLEILSQKFSDLEIKTILEEAFEESEILDRRQAAFLWANCVMDDSNLPTTENILTETLDEPPSPIEIIDLLGEYPDDHFVFVFLFKGKKFGAFSTGGWDVEGESGSSKNFLFSLDRNQKFLVNKRKKKKIYQWCTDDALGFGASDLILVDSVS